MKLTKEQTLSTAHLSQREAAKELGVGKGSVQRARERYLKTPPESPPAAALTHVTIEDDMRANHVTEGSHKLSYSYSEWDMGGGKVGRSRRVTAVPLSLVPEEDRVDPLELFKQIKKESPEPEAYSSGSDTFVISFNDWQFGKKTRQGGTEDTIRIVTRAIENAKVRIAQLTKMGYDFSELIIIFGGDLVEGCTIYPNMSFSLEMARRQQIEGCVTLGLNIIDELAPLFKYVQVLGVRGNHGENRIDGNKTTLEDNDDTHVVAMMKLATDRDASLQHIEYRIANDEAGVYTVAGKGWVLGTTHGDVYGKGVGGATVERKVNTWYKNMAAGRDPLGSVDVMVTHHYHHRQSADYGSWEWHQTPAQDGAMSEYFRQSTGNYSEPGVLSFVMGEERYVEEKIL